MWAVVPIKQLNDAKQRLAGVLTPVERSKLCEAMVSDVLSTLRDCADLEGVLVVSPDSSVKALAERFGCEFLPETELDAQGFNAVVDAAVAKLAAAGVASVMVVHGDLPLLSDEDLTKLVTTHMSLQQPAVTINTDRHGLGSNCVIVTPASRLDYCFGPDSLALHVRQAKNKQMSVSVEHLPGVALDIDTAEDLRTLAVDRVLPRGGHTGQYLESIRENGSSALRRDRFRPLSRVVDRFRLSE